MGSIPIGISASRGCAILGLSKYQTQFEIWQIMMEQIEPGFNASRGYVLPDPVDNAAVRWGKGFEKAIIKVAELKSNNLIINHEAFFTKKISEVAEATTHIDGIYANTNDLHEGKTVFEMGYDLNWGEAGTNRIPRDYQVQCQHQLICTGADRVILSALIFPKTPEAWEKEEGLEMEKIGDNFFRIFDKKKNYGINPEHWAQVLFQMGYFKQYIITPDPEVQEMMLQIYSDYWNNNILNKIPPEPTTYEDLKRLIPIPKGTVIADAELEKWAVEYQEITAEIGSSGRLAKRKEVLKFNILNKMRTMDKAIDDDTRESTKLLNKEGKRLCTWTGKIFRA